MTSPGDWYEYLFPEKFYSTEGVKQRAKLNAVTREKNETLIIKRQERMDEIRRENEVGCRGHKSSSLSIKGEGGGY